MTATRPGGAWDAAIAGIEVRVALLGEIALRRDAELVAVPGGRARLLVAALATHPGRSRSAHALIEDIWGGQPPKAPMNALHTQVSRLRSLLPEGALEIGPAGYRLLLPAAQVDLSLAHDLEQAARANCADSDWHGCLRIIAAARALWRGEPGADLPDGPVADELRELAQSRWAALDRLELTAREGAGDISGALALARRAAAAEPLDEPTHATLMRLLAAAGRANEALETFAALRGRLGEELGTDPGPALVALHTAILRGELPVPVARNSSESLQTMEYGAGRPDPASQDGATAALGLRAAPNPLLGRDGDLAALEKLTGEFRVTTISGPGGTGKTRVANELGMRVAHRQSVALVELASLRADHEGSAADRSAATCADIEAAIGAVLGVGDYSRDTNVLRRRRTADGRRRLREALTLRPTLLILDNCEHLIDAVAEVVADLVGSCPQLTVVTTSRAPLSITAETVYPLPPLAIDSHGSPATELFVSRAHAVRPSARLDPEVVARLCRTLDGLPLAIELAAARIRTMSAEEIETRLEHRFALLRSGDRSSPQRHRTLHAVIEWSWNLLEPEQRIALRRLCRFPAGFTLDAAEYVVGKDDSTDAVAAVDGLAAQSLLTVLADDNTGATRFRMLETVREFGEEQLAAASETDLVMDRMCVWAREFAFDAARRYDGPDQVDVVLAVGAELDNLLAVMRYAIDIGDARTVRAVFGVVSVLWIMRGAHAEMITWAPRIMAVPATGVPSSRVEADLEIVSGVLLVLHLGFAEAGLRPIAVVRSRIRRILASDIESHPGVGYLGGLLCLRVSVPRAMRYLAAGVRSADPEIRGVALFARANLRENASNYAGSLRDAAEALRISEPRDVWGTAMALAHIGQMSSQMGHYAEAVGYFGRAVDSLQRLSSIEEGVELRSFRAVAMVGAGQLEQARAELDAALEIIDGGNDGNLPLTQRNPRRGVVMAGLAEYELATGDTDAGLRDFRNSLELVGWPTMSDPGPGDILTAAAVLSAHVLNDRTDLVPVLAKQLVDSTAARMIVNVDIPQLGGAGCAVGSYLAATGIDPRLGLTLLVLGIRAAGRQDFLSLLWHRHLDLLRGIVGADAVAVAQHGVARVSRRRAADRIMATFRTLSATLPE
ncbi:MAG: transcriptional regulator [Nocardia sp.]|nr:transcriptional regulator [Nocardia sp.]